MWSPTYGAETWTLKAQEKKLDVAEMRMLRWMCGFTKLDKIRNERIWGTTKVGEITKKVQERRLKWYGHVMRREEHYVGRRAMVMKVQEKMVGESEGWHQKEGTVGGECVRPTVLHGGVCHSTSTPHKSGNKMKEKKNVITHCVLTLYLLCQLLYVHRLLIVIHSTPTKHTDTLSEGTRQNILSRGTCQKYYKNMVMTDRIPACN